MKGSRILKLGLSAVLSLSVLAGCSTSPSTNGTKQEINLYTSRHYETDQALFDEFTKKTGVKVNVVKGDSNELMERLSREGAATPADLFITADAGNLHRAKEKGLLQTANSNVLDKNIPTNFRDPDHQWFGLTKRARVIVYAKDRVKPTDLSTYEDLTNPKWKGKVLIRSSENIYNQSMLASFIALNGEEKAKEWAKGIVTNMARQPKGNDRDQAKAVVAGEGDLAIMNTYYVGNMLTSKDPEERKVAEKVGVFFPNPTHINISGIGLTKHAKNKENAIKFMEFLSEASIQEKFAGNNNEFPVNPNSKTSQLLKSWGEFKPQDIPLSKLGEYNAEAIKIFNEVGWK